MIQQVGLFPHMTVADNVAIVPRLLRWPAPRIKARVDELLELVGLDPGAYAGRYPAALSGGERQRIGVARALAADPPVMLMDEPFGAVDPIRRERLQNEFLRLQAQVRKTVVFVTHDVDEAIKMADRIAILQRGGILAQYDTPDAILANPASEFVEHFVEADRGLKRLSLGRVRDLDLEQPIIVRLGESGAEALARMAGQPRRARAGGRRRRSADRLDRHERRQDGSASGRGDGHAGLADAQPETTLRDALSAMLLSSVQLGVVVDGRDRVLGVISVDAISDALRPGSAATDTGDGGHPCRGIGPVREGQPFFRVDWVIENADVLPGGSGELASPASPSWSVSCSRSRSRCWSGAIRACTARCWAPPASSTRSPASPCSCC